MASPRAQNGTNPSTLNGAQPAAQNIGATVDRAPLTQQELSTASAASDTQVLYRYVIAWTFVILVAVALYRTRLGAVIITWSLWLMVLFVVVTQYQFVAWILQPFTRQQKGG